jgi:tRNA uridine 5-carboxymethylaminomethyl modification enzyme
VNDALARAGSAAIVGRRVTLAELMRRPELGWDEVEAIALAGGITPFTVPPAAIAAGVDATEVTFRVETELVYEHYLRRQEVDAERLANADAVRLPDDLDYATIAGLSREVIEKLSALRPRSVGQASRVSGVTPAAVSILMTHLALTRRRAADVPSRADEGT